MLPTNVMTFMKKMVSPEESQQQQQGSSEGGGTFEKLKQTLSSSLLTTQEKVNTILVEPTSTESLASNQSKTGAQSSSMEATKAELSKIASRLGTCRVCLKSFQPDDFSKICMECNQKVCEDCASYSKYEDNDDNTLTWRCSVCRRKMSSRVCIPQDSTDSMLDVPIMDTLQRRHSDIKIGSSQQLTNGSSAGLVPPRSPEVRRHSDVSPASIKELEKLKSNDGWNILSSHPNRSKSPSKTAELKTQVHRSSSRRNSNVARQHSYDEDMKMSGDVPQRGALGLELPAIPRRASAYDVFTPSPSGAQAIVNPPMSRRASFRAPPQCDSLSRPDKSPSPESSNPTLGLDEDRRMRRRGSQLPDIAALRDKGALPCVPPSVGIPSLIQFQPPNLEDLEAPKPQTSMDGDIIRIIIHDVDSGPHCAAKRRVTLRRDPTDKAHRTRGFGMRVVGGKTGTDGRLFAYIVWTIPGGPAEKGGLQQGDKVLEWNSMSLTDRSFEEVCALMDKTEEVVDLLVEQAADYRMCDLLDDASLSGSSDCRKFSNAGQTLLVN